MVHSISAFRRSGSRPARHSWALPARVAAVAAAVLVVVLAVALFVAWFEGDAPDLYAGANPTSDGST